MDMKKKLSSELSHALEEAFEQVLVQKHAQVDVWHLLAVWLKSSETIQKLLLIGQVNLPLLKEEVAARLAKLPRIEKSTAELYYSQGMNEAFRLASATQARHQFVKISSAVFLLALVENETESGARLRALGLKVEKILQAIKEQGLDSRSSQEEIEKILNKYTTDFTQRAKNNQLDPVLGRDEEIRRITQVLQRRTKNNPVLIGAPGVGKSAIVEGLAQRIIDNEVPASLRKKRILALDVGLLVSNTTLRGQLESRIKELLSALEQLKDEVILFIDELHVLTQVGGDVSLVNMLKPVLARGQLRCIGATTLDEYRMHLEKDGALERRFQKVLVEEPSVEETIGMLRGLKERYALHHHVQITDAAIVAAAKLTARYIPARQLPDKAIDAIDEAAAALRLQMDSKPEKIDRLQRRLTQWKVQQKMLLSESAHENRKTLSDLEQKINQTESELAELVKIWTKEKEQSNRLQQLKEKQQNVSDALQQALRENNLEEMARLQYGVLPELARAIEAAEKEYEKERQDPLQLLKIRVSEQEILEVISQWTKIPVQQVAASERERLLEMEQFLEKRVIGQREAVASVCNAIRRNRAGLSDPNRPIGSFLCLGPTGVGKTELARTIAEFLFDSDQAMVRIDMSEYMERHSVSRLIGAPPGYIGYEAGGTLTEAVRTRPYSVVLFDEVEKAHPDVFHLLLQVLDDGRLTDSQGKVINFKNCVIFLTSNFGAETIQAAIREERTKAELRGELMAMLGKLFRPEFLNRLDEVLIFEPLSRDTLRKIIQPQMARIAQRLAQIGYTLEVDASVAQMLLEEGYDAVLGARPLKRAIQNFIENPLASAILKNENGALRHIKVTLDPERAVSVELENRAP